MEKQHNRGQDGAGLANIKFDVEPGTRFISRYRSIQNQPIKDIFSYVHKRFEALHKNSPEKLKIQITTYILLYIYVFSSLNDTHPATCRRKLLVVYYDSS